jgi:16S rRNA (cytosine967-C5)-methyltransferase
MNKGVAKNPRQRAIAALSDVLDRGLNLTDSPALHNSPGSRDLSMSRHLAYGVVRWLTALDWLAGQMLSKPIKRRDRDIQRLILLGLYQLWQDESPAHAAIHETAECARLVDKPWAVAIINAVLRRFQRERELWLKRLSEQDEQYAHPLWMLEKLRADWPRDWQNLVTANNHQARMWLRVNRRGPGKLAVIEQLQDQGFEVQSHPAAVDAICITPAAQVNALQGFAAGHYSVQDPAAQLAADLLDVQTGMHVLDACAAPGGKACHLLERTPGANLTAVDHHARRMDLVRENFQRLNLHARLIIADATEPAAWWDGIPFQRILLDAPCSATGVIRRHPEIKHLRQEQHVHEATQLQQRLLRRLWPLLDAGGILVYATCSIFRDENSTQISNFLAQQSDAGELLADVAWGHGQQHGRQIFPGEQDMDGFYYAVLQKIS